MSRVKPYYDDGQITIYHGDCRDGFPVDETCVIVTDPPYGTGGWRRGSAGARSNPAGSLVRESWDDGDYGWIGMCSSAAAVVTFAPAASTLAALAAANRAGFDKHRAVYMQKRDPKPMPGGRVRWSMEPVWVLSRDGFILVGETDCYPASTPRRGRDAGATGHPYEKPLEVMTWLIGMLPAGLTVIDPFMGSGTTIRAAKDLGRRAIGIEMHNEIGEDGVDRRYCDIAVKRLAQEVLL